MKALTKVPLIASLGVLAVLLGPVTAVGAGGEDLSAAAERVMKAVVGVRASIPQDARTARSLGTEREGSGVVIGADGLILTIGYLILEAVSAEVVTPGGETVPAAVIGYDYDTGFGLLRARRLAGVAPLRLGRSSELAVGDRALAVSLQGAPPVTPTRVVSRRPFAGFWEYLLENAIFTSPPHGQYGGAALIAGDGRLVGIGSLYVGDAMEEHAPVPGNMFVPIDLLKPILADMLEYGRSTRPPHPWLGLYPDQAMGRVFLSRVAPGGPAEAAGLKAGDIVVGVGGKRVRDIADFFRKVWARGDAGVEIPIDVVPMGSSDLTIQKVVVRSRARHDWLKSKER